MPRLPVLVVEDNDIEQFVLKTLLERFDFQAVIVNSGGKALQLLQKNVFSAVLMDIGLPDIDGLECTRQIRFLQNQLRSKPVPIIALTARTEKQVKEAAEQAGMDGYLCKPFRAEELRRILLQHIYNPAEPNLKTLRPVTDIKDLYKKRNGTR